jgi:hypothetical protein
MYLLISRIKKETFIIKLSPPKTIREGFMMKSKVTTFVLFLLMIALVSGAQEICDGIDNDLDQVIDNGFNIGSSCTGNVTDCGNFNSGTVVCSLDGLSSYCDATTPAEPDADSDDVSDCLDNCNAYNPTQSDADDDGIGDACDFETCDYIDNDGDFQIDEGYNLGQSCISGSNSCGDYNTGNYGCSENGQYTVCSAVTPDERSFWHQSCRSKKNWCGDYNLGYTDCNGVCNAIKPAERSGWLQPCYSAPNICGDIATGITDCEGACSAVTPGIPDQDHDNVADCIDNCIIVYNPTQVDLDKDDIGDACDSNVDSGTGGSGTGTGNSTGGTGGSGTGSNSTGTGGSGTGTGNSTGGTGGSGTGSNSTGTGGSGTGTGNSTSGGTGGTGGSGTGGGNTSGSGGSSGGSGGGSGGGIIIGYNSTNRTRPSHGIVCSFWNCTTWTDCSMEEIQGRNCTPMVDNCPYNINTPEFLQNCSYVSMNIIEPDIEEIKTCIDSPDCMDWTACEDGRQFRICKGNCTGNETREYRECISGTKEPKKPSYLGLWLFLILIAILIYLASRKSQNPTPVAAKGKKKKKR